MRQRILHRMSFLKDNYRFLLARKGVSSSDVSRSTGISQPALSKIERGISENPRLQTLNLLAEYFGVSVSDLINSNLSDATEIEEPLSHINYVPLISWVQAGNWQEVIDNLHPGEGERIPTVYKAREHTYALRVHGDSMEPKFSNGDIIIVEPGEQPENGSYVVVRQNGSEATFKQLCIDGSNCFLKPLNSRYPIMEMKQDAVICGVVKWKQSEV